MGGGGEEVPRHRLVRFISVRTVYLHYSYRAREGWSHNNKKMTFMNVPEIIRKQLLKHRQLLLTIYIAELWPNFFFMGGRDI